jgi:dihydroorotate dehydrogenase
LPVYDIAETYDWNYDHAPDAPPDVGVPPCPGEWDFCGIQVNSPLGVPAGPLLNSRWVLYYAALGFDVVTYKTVRSRYRASFAPPNLLPVSAPPLTGEGSVVEAASAARSWAISFGMPSKDPALWQADVERARKGLRAGQVLVVSVVASPEAGWTMDQVADDFALCARWAAESGAQVVEANLSCPNVCSKEADLYLDAQASGLIAARVRDAAQGLPVALKIGLFPHREQAEALVESVAPYAAALSSANSITARVSAGGRPLFEGLKRGIGGACITARCLEELKMLRGIVEAKGLATKLIGVGGVMNAADVRQRLAAGAHHVQLATAPMLDPEVGLRIRKELA